MSNSNLKIYTPESSVRKPGNLIRDMITDIKLSKELAFALAKRDISAMFRQSILGYVWAFLPVIATTGVFLFLRSGGAFTTGGSTIPYPVYVLVGTIIWQIFVDSVNGPLKVVNSSRAMIVKINFPREALILAAVLITLFNFLIRLIILIPALIFFASQGIYEFTPESLVYFPLGVAGIVILGYSIGLLLTPVGMLYKDVQMGIQMIMMFWMFISPVVITIPESGFVAKVMTLNPVTPVLDSARSWLLGIKPEFLNEYIIVISFSLFLVLFGWFLYRVALPHVISRLGM